MSLLRDTTFNDEYFLRINDLAQGTRFVVNPAHRGCSDLLDVIWTLDRSYSNVTSLVGTNI